MKNAFRRGALALALILLTASLAVGGASALAESVTTDTTATTTETASPDATPTATAGTDADPTATPAPEIVATDTTSDTATDTAVIPAVAPTSVKLSASKTLKLAIGDQLTLTPTLKPENAATTFKWKSSNKTVASVSNGVVTGKKAGSAIITVTTANKKTSTVTIKVYDPYLPSSVKLDQKGTIKLGLGDTLTLTPSLSPETAKSTYKWSSSKKKVAKVSSKGVVTAKKVGTTTITVTTRNKKKAKVKIKVYDPYLPSSVKLEQTGTVQLPVGEKLTLTPSLSPETAKSTYKWKSSKTKFATVSSKGVVTAKKVGTTTITVTTRNKKTAKVKIKVIAKAYEKITTPEDYNLPYVIYASKYSHTVAVLAKDDNGEWTRTIKCFSVATGKNNCTDVGTFTIAKKERWHEWSTGYSPYSNKLSVGIHIHGPLYESKNINAMYTPQYNKIGTDATSGCLRATSGGSAWIYYNCPLGTQVIIANDSRFTSTPPTKLKSSVTTDPTDPGDNPEILLTGFSVTPESLSMKVGDTQMLTPTALEPSNTSTTGFKYLSSDTSVATVDAQGVVTAVANGTAVIVVTGNDAFKASVTVPVTVGDTVSTLTQVLAEAGTALTQETAPETAATEQPAATPVDEVTATPVEVAPTPTPVVETPVSEQTDAEVIESEAPSSADAPDDVTAEDTSVEDASAEDTTVEDASADTSVEDATAEDTSVEDTSAEDTSVEDTSAEDAVDDADAEAVEIIPGTEAIETVEDIAQDEMVSGLSYEAEAFEEVPEEVPELEIEQD